MFPADPSPTSAGWHAHSDPPELTPTPSYTRRFLAAYARTTTTDEVYHFTFPSHSDASPLIIHESRLKWAGGPLAALRQPGFAENETRSVQLPAEDDPTTFAIIRAFLYCDVIDMKWYNLEQVVRATRSAHRWQLFELFEVLCVFISASELVESADDVLAAAQAVELPDVPGGFRDYFWKCAAQFFDDLSPGVGDDDVVSVADDSSYDPYASDADEFSDDDDELTEEFLATVAEFDPDDEEIGAEEPGVDEGLERSRGEEAAEGEQKEQTENGQGEAVEVEQAEIEETAKAVELVPVHVRLCPRFPRLWDLALSQGVIVKVLHDIAKTSVRNLDEELLLLVLEYLEPRIEDDSVVTKLIDMFIPVVSDREQLFHKDGMVRDWSSRAMILFLESLLSARNAGSAMSWGWNWSLVEGRMEEMEFVFGQMGASKNFKQRGKYISERSESTCAIHLVVKALRDAVDSAQVRVGWNVGGCFRGKRGWLQVEVAMSEGLCFCTCCEGDEPPDGTVVYSYVHEAPLSLSNDAVEFLIPAEVLEKFDERHAREAECMINFQFRARVR